MERTQRTRRAATQAETVPTHLSNARVSSGESWVYTGPLNGAGAADVDGSVIPG